MPSREDLSSLPAVLLVFGGAVLCLVLFGSGSEGVLPAVYELAALPAAVALAAALLTKILR